MRRVLALSAGRKLALWSRIVLAALVVPVPVTIAAGAAHAVTAEAPADRLVAYGARIAGDEARTRIVLDFDRAPTIETRYIANPDRIVKMQVAADIR